MTDGLTEQADLFGGAKVVDVRRTAVISPDGLYRYWLARRWDHGPTATFVMNNPSTADGHQDDATIRRCIGFAKREGCAGLVVVNLFALRSTDPDALLTAADPHGPENMRHLRDAIGDAKTVIVAWGAWYLSHSAKLGKRRARPSIESLARDVGVGLYCLGTTTHGEPRHPLYVPADTPLEPWRP